MAKTWEGQISGTQIFSFPILDKDKETIGKLKEYQGNYVKPQYVERYATFFWSGDTKYFVAKVGKGRSPHSNFSGKVHGGHILDLMDCLPLETFPTLLCNRIGK